jgi:hypothetical protein
MILKNCVTFMLGVFRIREGYIAKDGRKVHWLPSLLRQLTF